MTNPFIKKNFDRQFLFNKKQENTEKKEQKEFLLSELQYKILICMREHPYMTQVGIANKLGICPIRLNYHLKRIKQNNPELEKEIKLFDKRKKLKRFKFLL